MAFELEAYSPEVQRILAVAGGGNTPMPLTGGVVVQAGLDELEGHSAPAIFPGALSPDAALAGLYLYLCDYDRAHGVAQDLPTVEGSYWHAILHRQEPDPGNAGYWFRRVGQHPIFPELREAAAHAGFKTANSWDPFAFIDYCEKARRKPGSKDEEIAMAVQLAEWQLLFDYCARPQR